MNENENKKILGTRILCVSHVHTTIERRRVSVSVGRSVGTCMLPLFVCFFFARSAAKLYYFLHTVRTR